MEQHKQEIGTKKEKAGRIGRLWRPQKAYGAGIRGMQEWFGETLHTINRDT